LSAETPAAARREPSARFRLPRPTRDPSQFELRADFADAVAAVVIQDAARTRAREHKTLGVPLVEHRVYSFWLGKFKDSGGDYHKAQTVLAFLDSIEYRQHFAQ
jgi:hypothetical protein